ncbi:MAG: GAF domain-containing protein [Melioribacteraceae bacterium]|nr:GAF domain-containing protein [Melioribacteraceae bacterium]
MSENINIDQSLSDEKKYQLLIPQIEALIDSDIPIISNLSNITAVLMDAFVKISWVGFYIKKNDKLFLGSFQGKVACTTIKIGNGVCGTSAANMETVIVKDVDSFPGHIACDAGSKSEIVLPVLDETNNLFAVLDIDSYDYSSFNEVDKNYLEQVCDLLSTKLKLSEFSLS